ncbi:DUF5959 family protein [Streptomyces sp. NRRL F-5126]|uniref:DUF5959 family protein n=1 Tax=Streptomyces sp. NRRL F-5126 TaxID=1463857 RepID=UPI0004C7D65D|nr:DUF5959 family protein [Streptomyces sp. NRRL F-5126]
MAQGTIDLIRLVGEGNNVVLRITGRETRRGARMTHVLTGEFVVDTPFIRGTLNAWVFPEDLAEWQECLDALDSGQAGITWREAVRGPALSIERDDIGEQLTVTIRDDTMSMTTVSVMVPLADSWFDDAYSRLEQVWKTWPAIEGH